MYNVVLIKKIEDKICEENNSHMYELKRVFFFKDPEPLEPVKKKVDPNILKNKLRKYTAKRVAAKKQPAPFVVGKVRHKIHSPPFLHGPKVATGTKKRMPLTPLNVCIKIFFLINKCNQLGISFPGF